MSKLLGIGIATLDIINVVDHYPQEDEELRTLSQRVMRGGNCTNTLVTLSQLGHDCSWAGTLSDEPNAQLITDELDRYRVNHDAVRVYQGHRLPTSYITLNRQNGSRTIVHHRDLPEYPFEDFSHLNLGRYQWVHFEGRNLEETAKMMKHVHALYPEALISLEVEKPRPGIESLFPYARVILFSRAYARSHGFDDGEAFLGQMATTGQWLFCGWGAAGAYAHDGHSAWFEAARQAAEVVDTIGAGDVFNAGVIHGLSQGHGVQQSLQFAVQLAGEHCAREGFEIKA